MKSVEFSASIFTSESLKDPFYFLFTKQIQQQIKLMQYMSVSTLTKELRQHSWRLILHVRFDDRSQFSSTSIFTIFRERGRM